VDRLGHHAQTTQRLLPNGDWVAHPPTDLGLAQAEQAAMVGLVGVLLEVHQYEVQFTLAVVQTDVGSFFVLLVHPPVVFQRIVTQLLVDQLIRAASVSTPGTFGYSS